MSLSSVEHWWQLTTMFKHHHQARNISINLLRRSSPETLTMSASWWYGANHCHLGAVCCFAPAKVAKNNTAYLTSDSRATDQLPEAVDCSCPPPPLYVAQPATIVLIGSPNRAPLSPPPPPVRYPALAVSVAKQHYMEHHHPAEHKRHGLYRSVSVSVCIRIRSLR